jgi:hypothetical protein
VIPFAASRVQELISSSGDIFEIPGNELPKKGSADLDVLLPVC